VLTKWGSHIFAAAIARTLRMRFWSCRSGWDPAELADSIEHPFDAISVLVSMIVASRWVLAPCARRNIGLRSAEADEAVAEAHDLERLDRMEVRRRFLQPVRHQWEAACG